MARKYVLNYVEGDELDDLDVVWEKNGQAVDVSTFSSIKLLISYENGRSLSVDAVIDDAPNGKFHFEFGEGDLIRGQHEAEIEFRDGTKPKTFPTKSTLILDVRADLG